jgi:hypothetical protein
MEQKYETALSVEKLTERLEERDQ